MNSPEHDPHRNPSSFLLEKWYLDFVDDDDNKAMIFYAARLVWNHITIPYTSFISYQPDKGIHQQSRYRSVHFPEQSGDKISWSDPKFNIKGDWIQSSAPISQRLFDSESGYLDWRCHQPSSLVTLEIDDKIQTGTGYAEQILLTELPWHIPMQDLRWGRVHADKHQIVWIELLDSSSKQWVWLDGEKLPGCKIMDDSISCPEKEIELELIHIADLETGSTIRRVMSPVMKHLPGFMTQMTPGFLNTETHKWLSKAILKHENYQAEGLSIHEWVKIK